MLQEMEVSRGNDTLKVGQVNLRRQQGGGVGGFSVRDLISYSHGSVWRPKLVDVPVGTPT